MKAPFESTILIRLTQGTLAVGSMAALAAMLGLFIAGLLQIGYAVLYSTGLMDPGSEYPNGVIAGIKTAIKGLELFFLAPLPYVVIAASRRSAPVASTASIPVSKTPASAPTPAFRWR